MRTRALALLVCCHAGCMTSPLYGEHVGDWQDPVRFAGYTEVSGETITIEAHEWPTSVFGTGTWEVIGEATTSSSALVDPSGAAWYAWEEDIVLETRFWIVRTGTTDQVRAAIRATGGAYGGRAMTLFHVDTAEQCWSDEGYIGTQIAMNCSAPWYIDSSTIYADAPSFGGVGGIAP